jgi:hypothetical protein
LLIKVGDPTAGKLRGAISDWLIVAAVMGPALVLCVLVARLFKGRPASAVLLGAVSGSSLALFVVLTKGVVEVIHREPGHHLLHTWEFYVWILAGVSGMIFQQSAFRAGSLTASLPTITVAKPVVAVILGIAVLKESLQLESNPERALLIALTVLVIVSTVMLARGEAATISEDAEQAAHFAEESDVPGPRPSDEPGGTPREEFATDPAPTVEGTA